MERPSLIIKFVKLAIVPALALAVGLGVAQAQMGRDDHNHGNQPAQAHGNQNGHNNDQGNNFHFRDQDRNQLQSHYKGDVNKYRSHPQGRPQFSRGEHFSANQHFQAVPSSYYRGMPPPPPGYRYGYSNGYVVAYNPTTRIIGDVLDLVTAATR